MKRKKDGYIRIELNRKQFISILTLLVVCAVSLRLSSENLTVTTSYPSPTGIYKQMTTTDQTVLARDGGNVGIGTPNPTERLHIIGPTNGGFLLSGTQPRMKLQDSTNAANQVFSLEPTGNTFSLCRFGTNCDLQLNGGNVTVNGGLLTLGSMANDPALTGNPPVCTPAGAIYYNTTTNQLKYCDGGSKWRWIDSTPRVTLVTQLYNDTLGRAPDLNGAGPHYWVSSQMGSAQIVAGFLNSKEFNDNYKDDTAFVDALYTYLLGRGADSAGETYWVNLIAKGMKRADVVNGFMTSAECYSPTEPTTSFCYRMLNE